MTKTSFRRTASPDVGWLKSDLVGRSGLKTVDLIGVSALAFSKLHVHVHLPSRQDAQPQVPWSHIVEGAVDTKNT